METLSGSESFLMAWNVRYQTRDYISLGRWEASFETPNVSFFPV